jgi:hypothetical protein
MNPAAYGRPCLTHPSTFILHPLPLPSRAPVRRRLMAEIHVSRGVSAGRQNLARALTQRSARQQENRVIAPLGKLVQRHGTGAQQVHTGTHRFDTPLKRCQSECGRECRIMRRDTASGESFGGSSIIFAQVLRRACDSRHRSERQRFRNSLPSCRDRQFAA